MLILVNCVWVGNCGLFGFCLFSVLSVVVRCFVMAGFGVLLCVFVLFCLLVGFGLLLVVGLVFLCVFCLLDC